MTQESTPYPMLSDPGICQFMIESDACYPPNAVDLSIAQQRQAYIDLCKHFKKPHPADIKSADLVVSGNNAAIPIRIYAPISESNLPAMLYLHGGGFVVGGLESHDDICAEIAHFAEVNVVAVDYRLAPEHPFPAPFDDCKTVLNNLPDLGKEHGFDATRLVIGGDSAGGNLAAALCLNARDNVSAPTISGQVLIYPELGGDISRGSYVTQSNAPGLSTDDIIYYREIYAGPPGSAHRNIKLTSPLLEIDYSNLPPAFLVAAHFDPLHDDCVDYVERLQSAGVAAQMRREPLLVHSFLRARHMSDAAAASFKAITTAINSLAYKGKLP